MIATMAQDLIAQRRPYSQACSSGRKRSLTWWLRCAMPFVSVCRTVSNDVAATWGGPITPRRCMEITFSNTARALFMAIEKTRSDTRRFLKDLRGAEYNCNRKHDARRIFVVLLLSEGVTLLPMPAALLIAHFAASPKVPIVRIRTPCTTPRHPFSFGADRRNGVDIVTFVISSLEEEYQRELELKMRIARRLQELLDPPRLGMADLMLFKTKPRTNSDIRVPAAAVLKGLGV